jgi:hypothetical protein
MRSPDSKRFVIQTKLLADMLVTTAVAGRWCKQQLSGWQPNNGDYCYPLLYQYCVERLGIHRIPGYEDQLLVRIVSRMRSSDDNPFNSIPSADLKGAYDELAQLHKFTTDRIIEAVGPKVMIARCLRGTYAFRAWAERIAAIAEGRTTVEFDTLTLLACSGPDLDHATATRPEDLGYYGHYDIKITFEVEAQNVLVCDSAFGGYADYDLSTMESPEWIVLNRNPRGFLSVPVANFVKLSSFDDQECFRWSYDKRERHNPLQIAPDLARAHHDLRARLNALDAALPWWCRPFVRSTVRRTMDQVRFGMTM